VTSLAMPAAGTDHGAFRWGLSFAGVAAAHAAAVLALLYSPPSSEADFVAGAAVVMIDLPQAPAPAPPVPATDLPLGPEEMPVEQNPPPKEETKPPEQMAEVALQEPEPPKPQPPVEATAPPPSAAVAIAVPDEKPPTAGSDVQPMPVAVQRWQNSLSAQIRRFQRYPARAIARREQGSAAITFRIDNNGRVVESRIIKSSGSSDLDQELFAMVTRAQPLPKPPPDAKPADLEITFAMNFSLK
jgi:periplasmic protein TonB